MSVKLARQLAGHALCRPPRDAKPISSDYANKIELWRLDPDGKWRPDDRRAGLAFVGKAHDGSVVVWSARCKCKLLNGCAAGAGSDFAFYKLDFPIVQFVHQRPTAAKFFAKKKAKKKR